MTLVDSNVLIDILKRDTEWLVWSLTSLGEAAEVGPVLISPIVYGELAPEFASEAALTGFLESSEITLVEPSRTALYNAGRAFRDYRRAGGKRTRLLPDFLIGAQAEDLSCAVLTRDPRPYRTYFPNVRLITPWR